MNDYSRFYQKLNERQKEAVDAIDGPLLVLAGPGTGKTQLLSVRACSILKNRPIRPDNILILTYTNSAAKTMKERLSSIAGNDGYDVEVDTFHGFANSAIQESEEAAIYIGNKIQMSEVERVRVIEYVLDNTPGVDEIRPFRAPYTYLKEILQKIGDLKKDGVSCADFRDYLANPKSLYRSFDEKYKIRLQALSVTYNRYEELKDGKDGNIFDERGRYDFDDMILFAKEVLKKEPGLKKEYQAQYKYIMVDEFQDTNGSQLGLLFELLDYRNPNLLCVGDDDQSIYRFQGASIENFKALSKKYPKTKTMHLEESYRSTEDILQLSSRIIGLIPLNERIAQKRLEAVNKHNDREIAFGEFSTEEEELVYIVKKVKELKTDIQNDGSLTPDERIHPYNNIAVLLRKRSDILKIIDTFLQNGIPYATDGKEDIAKEVRVKQMLDVLNLAHIDPSDHKLKDLALYKVLSSDYFGIPQTDVLKILDYVNRKKASSNAEMTVLGEFLDYFSSKKDVIAFAKPDAMKQACEAITNLLSDARTRSLHTILMEYIKMAGIFKFILKEYSDNSILRIRQIRSLASFVNMIKASDISNPAIRLDDFMQELRTRKNHGMPLQGNLVTLTQEGVRVYTAHGSKGLEFHSVIIPFCLHNKNWPARPMAEKLPLPQDLIGSRRHTRDRDKDKELNLHDETRLFYVAATRAKSHLIFTASPHQDTVVSRYLSALGLDKSPQVDVNEEDLITKSLEMTDFKDPFTGTESILKDMVGALSLNPTRLNTYITCRRKFLYNDVLKLPGAKKKSLVFGNCVHKSLEDTYNEFISKGSFPGFGFFKQSFKKELRHQGVDKEMSEDCLNKMETLKNWFLLTAKNAVIPLGLERKLVVTIGQNIIFTGKYDRIEWQDEKRSTVRIVDYKTGKPDNHIKSIGVCGDIKDPDCDGYLRQLVCYKLLYEKDKKESKGRSVSHGVLVFAEPLSQDMKKIGLSKGQYVTKIVEISDDMTRALEELIKEVWLNIKNLSFEKLPVKDNKKCGQCDFIDFCWE